MNVITLYQPYASLAIAEIKTWETRGLPPNGDMRPEGVRGLPGRRVNAGDRVAIHAAAKPVRTLPTEMITSAWMPGSFDQPWSWGDEIVDILGRDREAQDALEADIAEHGIREGVHLGPDMRVWDGHHRIVAARRLGIKEIPISKDSLPTGVILGTVEDHRHVADLPLARRPTSGALHRENGPRISVRSRLPDAVCDPGRPIRQHLRPTPLRPLATGQLGVGTRRPRTVCSADPSARQTRSVGMGSVSEQLVLPIEQPISPLAHCAFRCGHTEVAGVR